jgi:hypothetical protein
MSPGPVLTKVFWSLFWLLGWHAGGWPGWFCFACAALGLGASFYRDEYILTHAQWRFFATFGEVCLWVLGTYLIGFWTWEWVNKVCMAGIGPRFDFEAIETRVWVALGLSLFWKWLTLLGEAFSWATGSWGEGLHPALAKTPGFAMPQIEASRRKLAERARGRQSYRPYEPFRCPSCQAEVDYPKPHCGRCGLALDWGGVTAARP